MSPPDEKTAWEAAQKAYKKRLEPIEAALKSLAKPFDDQLREEHKRQLDPKLREALDIPKDKRTPEQKRLASDAETQIKPSWDEIVDVMPPAVLSERAALRERLHEVEATAPDPLAAAYSFVNTGEDAPQSYILRLGDPHSPSGPRGSLRPASCSRQATGFPPLPPAAAPPSPTGSPRPKTP